MKRHGYFSSVLGVPAAATQVLRPPRRLFAPEPFAFEPAAAPPRLPIEQEAPRAEPQPHPPAEAQPAVVDLPSVEPAAVEAVTAPPAPAVEPAAVTSTPAERGESPAPSRRVARTRLPAAAEAGGPAARPPQQAPPRLPVAEPPAVMRTAAEHHVAAPSPQVAPPARPARRPRVEPPVLEATAERLAVTHRVPRASRSATPRPPSLHIGAIDVTVVPAQRVQAAPPPIGAPAPAHAGVRPPLQRPGLAPWYGLAQR
jgi:hypothetical protein